MQRAGRGCETGVEGEGRWQRQATGVTPLVGAMRKGLHPALQWIKLVSPHGRLVRVLAAKAFKYPERPTYIRDPGKQSETVGQLAKFRRRFDFAPPAAATSPSAAAPEPAVPQQKRR